MRISMFKYLLRWYRDKLLLKKCTRRTSNLVECIGYFLEEIDRVKL